MRGLRATRLSRAARGLAWLVRAPVALAFARRLGLVLDAVQVEQHLLQGQPRQRVGAGAASRSSRCFSVQAVLPSRRIRTWRSNRLSMRSRAAGRAQCRPSRQRSRSRSPSVFRSRVHVAQHAGSEEHHQLLGFTAIGRGIRLQRPQLADADAAACRPCPFASGLAYMHRQSAILRAGPPVRFRRLPNLRVSGVARLSGRRRVVQRG